MNAGTVSITVGMKIDFKASKGVLQPTDPEPFKADVRSVVAEYRPDCRADWLCGWRETLVGSESGKSLISQESREFLHKSGPRFDRAGDV